MKRERTIFFLCRVVAHRSVDCSVVLRGRFLSHGVHPVLSFLGGVFRLFFRCFCLFVYFAFLFFVTQHGDVDIVFLALVFLLVSIRIGFDVFQCYTLPLFL